MSAFHIFLLATQWETEQYSYPHFKHQGPKGLWARSTRSGQKNWQEPWCKDWHGTSAKSQCSPPCYIFPMSLSLAALSASLVASQLPQQHASTLFPLISQVSGLLNTWKWAQDLFGGHKRNLCKSRTFSLAVFASQLRKLEMFVEEKSYSASPLASMMALRTGQAAHRQHSAARHAGKQLACKCSKAQSPVIKHYPSQVFPCQGIS